MRDVNTILHNYKENMDAQQKLDKSLFEHKDKTEWKHLLEKRAKEYHRIYTENDLLLQELQVSLRLLRNLQSW
jgi:curved DNA-binding protein CbpA